MDYFQFIIWAHQVSVEMRMLKKTKVKLELIPDADMFIFFGKGKRDGVFISLIDIAKPTVNIENLMTQNKSQNILYT